mmetsp:Transcript_6775/g.16054  ORF Transcript_6775/g.16054 Transcript_6775/m.16054 type:complete len:262 (-) Transcript_6775:1473-2258(-)
MQTGRCSGSDRFGQKGIRRLAGKPDLRHFRRCPEPLSGGQNNPDGTGLERKIRGQLESPHGNNGRDGKRLPVDLSDLFRLDPPLPEAQEDPCLYGNDPLGPSGGSSGARVEGSTERVARRAVREAQPTRHRCCCRKKPKPTTAPCIQRERRMGASLRLFGVRGSKERRWRSSSLSPQPGQHQGITTEHETNFFGCSLRVDPGNVLGLGGGHVVCFGQAAKGLCFRLATESITTRRIARKILREQIGASCCKAVMETRCQER